MRKEIIEWIVSIVVAVALVLLIVNFVAKPYTVKGDSMDPVSYTHLTLPTKA